MLFSKSTRRRTVSFALLSILGVVSACSADAPDGFNESIGDGDGDGDGGERGGETGLTGVNGCALNVGHGVIRRLTASEYINSLASVLGRSDFPSGEPLSGNVSEGAYSTRADGLWVRDLGAQAIENHITLVAEWVAATDPGLVTGCSEFTDACAKDTARTFGERALRMPLTDEQIARYSAVFMAGEDFGDGLEMVVSAILQSPYFLYRRELGSGSDSVVPLNDNELSSSLSYFLSDSPPDADLRTAAASGDLRSEGEWTAQVERLTQTDAAEEKLINFVKEWLGLKDVLTQAKAEDEIVVSDSLRAAMMGEVEALVRHVYRTGGGVRDLLINDHVFVNAELAAHYGMSGPSGAEFERVPAGNRTGGLLGTAAYLLAHSTVDSSSPTQRGVFIKERILCQEVIPPPPSVSTELPPPETPTTTRKRYEAHLNDAVCQTCHETIDNYGFAFEGYDGMGRYRTEENGFAVDSTGVTAGFEEGDLPFSDSKELVQILGDSAQAQQCFHQNLVEFIVGQVNWDGLCSVEEVTAQTAESGGSLQESLKQVLFLPHISSRISQGEL